jgi:hypothetical protein
VSTAGKFASEARDFVPTPELDVGLIAGHPWGMRTIYLVREEIQYMVYDKLGRNVLACAHTAELAAHAAVKRLEHEAIPPEAINPRLRGMRFGHRSKQGSHLLHHTVIDTDGQVIAEGVDGREVAAALAVKNVVSRLDCLDATPVEFASTVVFALVCKGQSKNDLPFVYQNALGSDDQSAVMRALRDIWRSDQRLQQAPDGNEIMPSNPDMAKFVDAAQTGLLRYAGKLGGDINSMDMTFGNPPRVCRFVFHTGVRTKLQMLGALFDDYLQSVSERQAERARPGRPTH